MGLLDEAIREHLELKRRRGADPTEVAREERDALAPVFPDEDEHVGADSDNASGTPQPALAHHDPPEPDSATAGADLEHDSAFVHASTVGQETAELDMQAVMEDDDHAEDPAPGRSSAGVAAAPDGQALDDALDWRFPSGGGASETTTAPGGEHVDGAEHVAGSARPAAGGQAAGGERVVGGATPAAGGERVVGGAAPAAGERLAGDELVDGDEHARDEAAKVELAPGQERLSFE
jgi:hypothetical protein